MPTTVKAAAPITAKACAPDAVPPAMRLTLDAAGAAEVRAAMEAWLGGDGDLGFEPVRGIAFAKSKDDTGRDDPLPSYMARQDGLACGIHALWLRSHLHSLFRRQSAQPGVQCAHNICCYESMGEYTSTGTLILRKAQHGWQLAGYAEVAANGTLTRESVTAAYGEAKGAMETRLGERCPGEPPEGTF